MLNCYTLFTLLTYLLAPLMIQKVNAIVRYAVQGRESLTPQIVPLLVHLKLYSTSTLVFDIRKTRSGHMILLQMATFIHQGF